MKERMDKLIIQFKDKEYEFSGGGGGEYPAPDSVGTEEIKDESVMLEDLSPEVKDSIAERVSQQELDQFQV